MRDTVDTFLSLSYRTKIKKKLDEELLFKTKQTNVNIFLRKERKHVNEKINDLAKSKVTVKQY